MLAFICSLEALNVQIRVHNRGDKLVIWCMIENRNESFVAPLKARLYKRSIESNSEETIIEASWQAGSLYWKNYLNNPQITINKDICKDGATCELEDLSDTKLLIYSEKFVNSMLKEHYICEGEDFNERHNDSQFPSCMKIQFV